MSQTATLVAAPPALSAVQLRCSFGDGDKRRVILDDVTFELQPGTLSLLMGPSGSGKSTLLAILSGLLRPDSGRVLAAEGKGVTDVWSLNERQREQFRLRTTGFIFQGYNLFPALTAAQQLEIVLKWGLDLPQSEAREQSSAMLERLGMKSQMHKRPAQLSGGEKQRVAIGRALVKNPAFIFADEPTSALDWENGQQVMRLLRRSAHERGSAIFVVTHDHRLLPFVDVAYHLEDGHLTTMPRDAAESHS